MAETRDKTSMDFWFPLLEATGVPVPRTEYLSMPRELQISILQVLYGEEPGIDPRTHRFVEDLKSKASSIGFPCFLRTAHTSNKHSWDEACFLQNQENALQHVYSIAEFSECAGIVGLPIDSWYVRELLPSIKYGACPRYGNMPVAKEFRFFVEAGKITCFHPYWPLKSLQDGGWNGTAEDYRELCEYSADETELRSLATRVSAAVEGAWSVDILKTERGWFVTDMAEAHRSFHWEDCKPGGEQE